MAEQISLLTPVGRMVQGNPFEPQTKNMEGKPLMGQDGQPRSTYFFAIAIPKTDPLFQPMWDQVVAVAQAGFPGQEYNLPTFSWKYVDGDAKEHAGKEGFPGHHVLRCAGGFAPKVFQKGTDGTYAEVIDPTQLRRGYYIRANLSLKANGSATKPGVYLNPSMVEIVGYGPEIAGGPDPSAVFGAVPSPALPAEASATPVASGAPPAAPGTPAVTPPVIPPVASLQVPPPAPDFLAGPPAHVMTALAKGATYDAMIKAGWTDETLISNGMMEK